MDGEGGVRGLGVVGLRAGPPSLSTGDVCVPGDGKACSKSCQTALHERVGEDPPPWAVSSGFFSPVGEHLASRRLRFGLLFMSEAYLSE